MPPVAKGPQTFISTKRQKECPNCRDRGVIVYDHHAGDEVCSNCGVVVEERVMSEEQEWRNFSNTDGGGGADKSRVGGKNDSWLEDSVQSTTMMGGDKKFSRLAQAHEITTSASSTDKALKTAFGNLKDISEYFNFRENVCERCKEIVKSLQTSGNLRNKTGVSHMLAVTYIALREENMAMTLIELVRYDGSLKERDLTRAITRIKKALPNRNVQNMSYASAELAIRFCSRLRLADAIAQISDHVCRRAEQTLKKQIKPHIMAGASIYLVAQLFGVEIVPSNIEAVSMARWPTIVAVYREILPIAKQLVPPNWIPENIGGFNSLKRL